MDKKKVVINGRFYSQSITGVQRFAREFLIALDEHIKNNDFDFDFDFVLALPSDSFDVPIFSKIKISKSLLFKGYLWEQLILPSIAYFNPLINLCNTGPIFKRNQLVVIHDMAIYAVPEAYSLYFKFWYKLMYKAFSFNHCVIATVSHFSKMEIHNILQLPIESIAVLTEGREHILRVVQDKSIFNKFDFGRRPYVLAVSSMTPNKNFGIVVKAIEKIGSSADFDFIIAGGTNPKVFASTDNLLPSSVTHVGYVSDQELVALYNNAACFIFPSLYEGFGLPPMEAMTCGSPVLASNRASIPEICSDAAIYFDPLNADDVKNKLLDVLNDEDLRYKMRHAGLENVKRFSWQKTVAEVIGIIDRKFT